MEIAKSAACDDGDHGECEAGWCACWCHESGFCCDDDRHERETSEDDYIMFG